MNTQHNQREHDLGTLSNADYRKRMYSRWNHRRGVVDNAGIVAVSTVAVGAVAGVIGLILWLQLRTPWMPWEAQATMVVGALILASGLIALGYAIKVLACIWRTLDEMNQRER